MDWYRAYHGMPTDPKWLLVGRLSDTKPGQVAAVWAAVLDFASQASPRGSCEGLDIETLAEFYGWPAEDLARIVMTLEDRNLIVDGKVRSWPKRQPAREDDSTERVRKYRARKKKTPSVPSAPVPPAGPPVTHGNAGKRSVTQRNDRERVFNGLSLSKSLSPDAAGPDPRDGVGPSASMLRQYLDQNRADLEAEVDGRLQALGPVLPPDRLARVREVCVVQLARSRLSPAQ